MRKMKDSGIEWIGEIPEEWQVGKIKDYYELQTGFTPDTKRQDYYDDEGGYDWVTISDLSNEKFIYDTKNKISETFINEKKPEIIPQGSLLYSFKLSVGQVAFAGKDIYSNEAIASFLNKDNCNLRFLYYSSFMIIENANENIYGAKLLNQNLINNAHIIFPPLEEQELIADYLDEKVQEIDNIILKTQKTIEEYKKYKQSVITEAVTKGLNPNVEMKDSGIEWIGDIPKHWENVAIKRFVQLFNGKEIPEEVTKSETSFNVYGSGGIFKYTNNFLYDGESVLFGRKGSIGKPIYVNDKFWTVDTMYYTSCSENIICKLFYYILLIFPWNIYTTQTALPSIVGTEIFSSLIPLSMNLLEQQEIINYLDKKCLEIDNLITKKQELITQLETYKKSLIYECVTGKKEVGLSYAY